MHSQKHALRRSKMVPRSSSLSSVGEPRPDRASILSRSLPAVLALAMGHCLPALAQQLEATPPPAGAAKSAPYLPSDAVDFAKLLGPPPAPDTVEDRSEHEIAEALQNVDESRRRSAELDAQWLYPRFTDAFGGPIDRKSTPELITLLNRVLRDVSQTNFAAKEHFHRLRPFQRFQLQHVCGDQVAPKPDLHATNGSSYPSGHSSYGWAVAMILARVAPEHAEQLMARAREYAESRLICGAHFESDIEAGHIVAAAVVARLDGVAEFQADLGRARGAGCLEAMICRSRLPNEGAPRGNEW